MYELHYIRPLSHHQSFDWDKFHYPIICISVATHTIVMVTSAGLQHVYRKSLSHWFAACLSQVITTQEEMSLRAQENRNHAFF